MCSALKVWHKWSSEGFIFRVYHAIWYAVLSFKFSFLTIFRIDCLGMSLISSWINNFASGVVSDDQLPVGFPLAIPFLLSWSTTLLKRWALYSVALRPFTPNLLMNLLVKDAGDGSLRALKLYKFSACPWTSGLRNSDLPAKVSTFR